jgi:hypothetical protein
VGKGLILMLGDRYTGNVTHHRGLFAGLSAATAAVLVGAMFMLGVWHRVSGEVAQAVSVIVWALVAVLLAAAAYAVWFLILRARHHVTHPETLTRQRVRAEVIPSPSPEIPAIPAPAPLAALPPAVTHNWHLNDPDTAAAVIRAVADTTDERN